MNKTMIYLAALAALVTTEAAWPQTAGSNYDDQQVLIAQIQSDKRAIVLKSLELTDAEMRAFTPVYDEYQKERKDVIQRKLDLVNKYASNYGSMTDGAAKSIMKDWFKVTDDENALLKKYAKKVADVLPATKALRFVQIENKLNTLLALEGVRAIPLAK